MPVDWVVVGLDSGGTHNNGTILDSSGRFLLDRMAEVPSEVREGPDKAIHALVVSVEQVLGLTGVPVTAVRAVGLDTPGPASAEGVISSKGATNFGHVGWRGFDIRGALAERLGLPVIYNNDGNAAALYAHNVRFGAESGQRSSVAAIVGTGLGGGIIETGQVVKGAAGMAGELGHVPIPLDGLLDDGQPMPACNCGQSGDAESVASLTGIQNNLLPYWLTRYKGHALGEVPIGVAAKQVRTYGEDGDEMALAIFRQQAMALGRLFTIAANFLDPDAYFLGGGVVEAAPHFRDWFFAEVRAHTVLRQSSTAHGGSVAPMIVPVPPEGPRQSTREASGLLIWTAGSPPRSTSRVTGTPKASPMRARVARLGLERPCSSATSTPLLTPERAASWSSDQPRSARSACRVRAIAAVISGTSAMSSSLGTRRTLWVRVEARPFGR